MVIAPPTSIISITQYVVIIYPEGWLKPPTRKDLSTEMRYCIDPFPESGMQSPNGDLRDQRPQKVLYTMFYITYIYIYTWLYIH